jgi:hypothetical protein
MCEMLVTNVVARNGFLIKFTVKTVVKQKIIMKFGFYTVIEQTVIGRNV